MGKLYENELTKTFLDTMEEYFEYDVLGKFLELLSINITRKDKKTAVFDNFEFKLSENSDLRREIDGIIQTKRLLIFIEAKVGANKHNTTQLINEYTLGSQEAQNTKKSFYLVAIDENITEPKVIHTVRNSSYAKVKKDQIKWISWHEITNLLIEIFDNQKFDSPITERIINKRIEKFKDQGFKSFEGFNRSDVNTASKADAYLKAFESINTELYNLIKGIQIEVNNSNINRIYKISSHRRKSKGRRKTVKSRQYHLYWEQLSFGIGHKISNVVKSYTFPFADKEWAYDLKKDKAPYYIYLKYDFFNKSLSIGFSISVKKNIKSVFKSWSKFSRLCKKYKFFQRRPLHVTWLEKGLTKEFKSSEFKQELFKDFSISSKITMFYNLDIYSEYLLSISIEFLCKVRDMVNEFNLIPIPKSEKEMEHVSIDDAPIDEEIKSLD